MLKPIKKILVLYKRSMYTTHRNAHHAIPKRGQATLLDHQLKIFKQAHHAHYATLKEIIHVLENAKISYCKCYRGQKINFSQFDFVITVGGDGTFLEAARHVKNQPILGVNSAPEYSVGKHCVANAKNFEGIFQKFFKKQTKIRLLHRMELQVEGHVHPVYSLNDVLICHSNPAIMSRYGLKIGKREEVQRSSGIWIATASGSTGAISSAGGKKVPAYARTIQYCPRELYSPNTREYQLTGGILSSQQNIRVTSLMRKGRIFVDGSNVSFRFPYGSVVTITLASKPIKTLARR